jgi:hypothetical protein
MRSCHPAPIPEVILRAIDRLHRRLRRIPPLRALADLLERLVLDHAALLRRNAVLLAELEACRCREAAATKALRLLRQQAAGSMN